MSREVRLKEDKQASVPLILENRGRTVEIYPSLKKKIVKIHKKIQKAVESHKKAGRTVGFKMEVGVHYNNSNLTSISIRPTTSWYSKGELGLDSFHIILGPQGGLRQASKSTTLGEEKNLNDWSSLLYYLSSAS